MNEAMLLQEAGEILLRDGYTDYGVYLLSIVKYALPEFMTFYNNHFESLVKDWLKENL